MAVSKKTQQRQQQSSAHYPSNIAKSLVPIRSTYVLEHIQSLDKVLADIERAGATISGIKSQFCMAGLKVVGFVCDINGRHPDTAKVIKILDWPDPIDITGARAFLGVCVYYRIWIRNFASIAEPIYRITQEGSGFRMGTGPGQRHAPIETTSSCPRQLSFPSNYSEGAGSIILAVDASLEGWGATLMQIVDGKRHPARYESGVWTPQEKVYDATKRV